MNVRDVKKALKEIKEEVDDIHLPFMSAFVKERKKIIDEFIENLIKENKKLKNIINDSCEYLEIFTLNDKNQEYFSGFDKKDWYNYLFYWQNNEKEPKKKRSKKR